ncbi:MAG: hypothetical protein GEU71_11090 [Actinobacteria bacterium]|nr:hypothetical protein [Actinomycetota bacterium]
MKRIIVAVAMIVAIAATMPAIFHSIGPSARAASASATAKKALKKAKKALALAKSLPPGSMTMGFAPIQSSDTTYSSLAGAFPNPTTPIEGISPPQALTMKDFGVSIPGMVAGDVITITVTVNGVDSGLGCTVIGPATSCTDGSDLVLPPRTSIGTIAVANNLASSSQLASWSWVFAN